jgi:hypothetical protein
MRTPTIAGTVLAAATSVTLAFGAGAGDQPEFKGTMARSYQDSVEWWADPVRPPEGAPNVIIFLLDDTGFAQIGSYGGLIEKPDIDRPPAGRCRRTRRARRVSAHRDVGQQQPHDVADACLAHVVG